MVEKETQHHRKNHRTELANFLRTRRARISPEQVGLPPGMRRRTPGLRREEVAQLVGVGITWYTWLEQGRDISVSVDVLENLVRVLRLNQDERMHLFALAGKPLPTANSPFIERVSPVFHQLLTALDPYPAHIRGQRGDVLAWNRAESVLITDWKSLPVVDRNVVWNHFTNLTLRQHLLDWEGDARAILALFRMENANRLETPWFAELIARLHAVSPEFRRLWAEHEVLHQRTAAMEFFLPQLGHYAFQRLILRIEHDPPLTLRVLMPEPSTDIPAKLRSFLE